MTSTRLFSRVNRKREERLLQPVSCRCSALIAVAVMLALMSACGGGSDTVKGALAEVVGSVPMNSASSGSSGIELGNTSSASSSSVASSETVSGSSSSSDSEGSVPVADAGAEQFVATGTEVILDASASFDADGDALSYQWQLTQVPEGSEAVLVYATSSMPSFIADLPGTFTAFLVVSDGQSESAAASVTIFSAHENLDITGIELTGRAGSCRNYVGSYFSNVEDIQRAVNFEGDFILTSDGSWCTFSANEIPNHNFNDAGAKFATAVSEQNGSYTITASPEPAASVTSLSIGLKNIVFLNGVTADLLSAACYDVGGEPLGEEKIGCGQDSIDNPWRYDPMSALNDFGTDSHNAHPQPDGTYHYHGSPRALFDLDCEINGTVSPVVGFAADGFPVYGPCIEDTGAIRAVTSSYALKRGERIDVAGYTTPVGGVGNVSSSSYDGQFIGDYEYQEGFGDLDECNGMTLNGQYGYYITNAYPWLIGCFKGEPDASFRPTAGALQNLLHKHDGRWHGH